MAEAGGEAMGKYVVVRRRRSTLRRPFIMAVAIVLLVLTVVLLLSNLWGGSDARKAKAVVTQFFAHEHSGDFGSSWELFHPRMKELYPKEAYMQAKTNVMQQLGARNMTFEISEKKRQASWRMEAEGDPLANVYRIQVVQRMDTVFGMLEIRQHVFVAKESGEWTLLWPFGESV